MRKKLLIVDDDRTNRYLLASLVNSATEEFEIVEATNGMEAIDMVKKEDIDLVFMDFKMPGMDGGEASRHIKDIRENIPIILITAYRVYDIPCLIENSHNYFDKVLTKPIDKKELDISLSNYCD